MSDEQVKEDERETPSIMVDPSLTRDDEDESFAFLTDEDADRAADSIRPSWAPSTPPPPAAVSSASAPPPPIAAPRAPATPPGPVSAPERIAEDALLAGTRKRKRKGQLLVAVAAAAVAAMLVLPLLSSVSAPTPAEPSTAAPADALRTETAAATAPAPADRTAAEPVATPAPVSAPPPVEAEVPAAPDADLQPGSEAPPVMFRIRTVPRRAKLFLDGEAVDNPFDGPVPGGRDIVIEARARHFIPTRLTARSDRDRIIGVSLKRRKRK